MPAAYVLACRRARGVYTLESSSFVLATGLHVHGGGVSRMASKKSRKDPMNGVISICLQIEYMTYQSLKSHHHAPKHVRVLITVVVNFVNSVSQLHRTLPKYKAKL